MAGGKKKLMRGGWKEKINAWRVERKEYCVAGGKKEYCVAGGKKEYCVAGGKKEYCVAGGKKEYCMVGGKKEYVLSAMCCTCPRYPYI